MMAERITGLMIGAIIISGLCFILWHFGHPYSALFLGGAIFQHMSNGVFAALRIGVFRFTEDCK